MKKTWSSRSLGSRPQHGIFYALIRLTGTAGGYFLLIFVVSWYTLRPAVRGRSEAYIRRRFPESGLLARFLHTWKLQWAFGQCLVDRAAAGILGGFSFEREGHETLDALAGEGNGVILLAAHTGCWQMAPYALAGQAGRPVTVLVHRDAGDHDKHAHEHAGKAPPFQVINTGDGPGASIALMRVLRQGGLLCMMGDRVSGDREPAVTVLFYGSAVRMPVAAYRLASASGSPVVCAFAARTGPRRGRLRIMDVIRVPPDLGREASCYAPYAQRFASALERFSRENPGQFFNFYDLWEQ